MRRPTPIVKDAFAAAALKNFGSFRSLGLDDDGLVVLCVNLFSDPQKQSKCTLRAFRRHYDNSEWTVELYLAPIPGHARLTLDLVRPH